MWLTGKKFNWYSNDTDFESSSLIFYYVYWYDVCCVGILENLKDLKIAQLGNAIRRYFPIRDPIDQIRIIFTFRFKMNRIFFYKKNK